MPEPLAQQLARARSLAEARRARQLRAVRLQNDEGPAQHERWPTSYSAARWWA